jgi:hypothetical protein
MPSGIARSTAKAWTTSLLKQAGDQEHCVLGTHRLKPVANKCRLKPAAIRRSRSTPYPLNGSTLKSLPLPHPWFAARPTANQPKHWHVPVLIAFLVPTLRVGTHWPDVLRPSSPRHVVACVHAPRPAASRREEQNDAERRNLAFPRGAWEQENYWTHPLFLPCWTSQQSHPSATSRNGLTRR